jgi:GNAT superfamily N-acetyltransferase
MKRRAKMLDLLLVAVKPEYQNKGVNALLFSDLIPVYQKLGFIFAESNRNWKKTEKSRLNGNTSKPSNINVVVRLQKR